MKPESLGEVPLCDLRSQYFDHQAEFDDAIRRVLASGQCILGPEVEALETAMASWCGASHGIGCSSGSDAILLALACLDIGPGDEVILPTFTFFATAGSVVRLGAKPVFVDIDPVTFNIDPGQIENKITPRTRAIMPVHLFGQTADMEPIWRIAERNNLPIIEDAAQSFGATYQGKPVGTLGAMACLSFYPTKTIGTFGDAGMVLTSDPGWASKLTCLRTHGMRPKYYHSMIGWNARIDALHAAILRVKLPYFQQSLANRRAVAKRYDELIEAGHLSRFLQRPTAKTDRQHVYNQYVVRVANGQRDALASHLKSHKIGTEVYYPLPLHLQECFAYLGYGVGDFPAAEAACRSVLALPMFPELTECQQVRVVDAIASFARRSTYRYAA